MRGVLVDAGPLLAALDRGDPRHGWAVAALAATPRITTVWPAVTEASHFLGRRGLSPAAGLLKALAGRGIGTVSMDQDDFGALAHLMNQYDDLPMDLADAALVHAYHRDGYDAVMTMDVKDFSVYRVAGKPLRLITPSDLRP